MKNRILVTQREYYFSDRRERADVLDQEWIRFLEASHLRGTPVPNRIGNPQGLFETDVAGVLLTGGGDIHADQQYRDKLELDLLTGAIERQLPVLAICRGAQLIADFYGWNSKHVIGHVGVRHGLIFNQDLQEPLLEHFKKLNSVNSFHNYGFDKSKMPENFKWIAKDSAESVEAYMVPEKNILALMWHPERENPFRKEELLLFEHFYTGKIL